MTFKPTFRDNFRQKIASPVKCIEQNRNGDLNAHLTANFEDQNANREKYVLTKL